MIDIISQQYKSRLDAIPLDVRGETRTKLVPWIYTNDHNFNMVMPEIVTAIQKQKRSGKPRIAVLSGVGSLLNIAPYTQADFFVSIDRNSFVLDQVKEMVRDVKLAPSAHTYTEQSSLAGYFGVMKDLGIDAEAYWEMEKDSFQDWHFLASEENYSRTWQTLIETPVLYTQGNFTHAPYVEALGKALAGTDVAYASFTDLGEWFPEFLDLVPLLNISDEAPIAWSTNKGHEGRPITQLSIGSQDYISRAKDLANELEVSYFKSNT